MSFIFRTENGDLIVQGENPGLPETMSSTYLNDEVTLLRMHKPVRHVYTWDQEIKARQIRFTILIFDDFFTIVDPLSDTVFEFTGARKVLLSNVRLNSDTNEID